MPYFTRLQIPALRRFEDEMGVGSWPPFIKRVLYCSRLGYKDRVVICCQVCGNNLDVNMMIRLLELGNPMMTDQKAYKMRKLVEWLQERGERGYERRERYFYYDHAAQRMKFLDGRDKSTEPHRYVPQPVGYRFFC